MVSFPYVSVHQACITRHLVWVKNKTKQHLMPQCYLACHILLSLNCEIAKNKNVTLTKASGSNTITRWILFTLQLNWQSESVINHMLNSVGWKASLSVCLIRRSTKYQVRAILRTTYCHQAFHFGWKHLKIRRHFFLNTRLMCTHRVYSVQCMFLAKSIHCSCVYNS